MSRQRSDESAEAAADEAAVEIGGFEVRLFGAGEACWIGRRGETVGWTLKRALQVLAYLATSPDLEASRDELRDAIWRGVSDEAVERNFHPTLSHLRRALRASAGGRLVHQPLELRHQVYRLSPELEWRIDTAEYERRCIEAPDRLREGDPEGTVALWEEAWRLHRGPFLRGFTNRWIETRREHFQRLHLELLAGLGGEYARAGRITEALDAFRSGLIEDPLQERLHLEVMRLYGRQGRRDLVRRQYERLTALLRRELGVAPLSEIGDEYRRLMG